MLKARSFSSCVKAYNKNSTIQQYVNDPVKLLVIPVTNKKSYVYFKYFNELLNKESALIRYETKLGQKVANIWHSVKNSKKSYNKKIVSLVTKLLDQIPWTENSLQTIPSESYILKRIENGSKGNVTLTEYVKAKNDKSMVSLKPKPIHVYYPKSVLNQTAILAQLKQLSDAGQKYHKKQAILCAVGIPISLPLVLIPIVPNVPGIYLTYRLYCNLKAYFGAKHLESLISNEDQIFEFINLEQYSDILEDVKKSVHNSDVERLLLSEHELDRVLDSLEIHEKSTDLRKAIRQESRKE
ncbi:unnamed protein product [Kluyveromyces dobzhanskii CBS 2104]|uniref:WGS project CCBQ000000000 data, contig 00015 n=1 Tax=Kluyveromyces dobzhanskii CBS 2104 TaxID=1427455 RepID=A0A0A8L9H1_9SACH|nr:unnamed protein product [Kluyveromyces dobzhanskii CBS 2104]